jgi:hypothetical protein
METASNGTAFPMLTPEEIASIEALGTRRIFEDGAIVFRNIKSDGWKPARGGT